MLIGWLVDVALGVAGAVLSLFSFMPTITLPAPLTLVAALPFVGSGGVSALNTWLFASVAVAIALAVGKALQWVYELIPFKGT